MENKNKEMTIEELETLYNKMTEEQKSLKEELKKRKQEEEDRRVAQLALDKEKRKKEVDEAFDNYRTLINAYIRDYGSYVTITSTSDSKYLLDNPWAWWM